MTQKLEAATSRLGDTFEKFSRWAASQLESERSGEWEMDYEHWPEATRAVSDLLDAIQPEELSGAIATQLLYLLARDNESEFLKDELVARPAHLLSIAGAALGSDEPDARWQVAVALGGVGAPDADVVPILEKFLEDQDEYVSRRALMAFARRKSTNVDPWAIRAWETGDQYQRMATLDALARSGSKLLVTYLDSAEVDGREYLVRFARELRDRGLERDSA